MEPLNSKASCRPVPVAPRLARSPAAAGHPASAAKALAEAAGAPGKGRVWQREIQRFSWDVNIKHGDGEREREWLNMLKPQR